jgi:hypothetical protein
MDAVSCYVMSARWLFLVSWFVMLLVAGAAVFRGDRGRKGLCLRVATGCWGELLSPLTSNEG